MQQLKGKRRLAAIMFTDMVGYTAMMQDNERLAIWLRDRHRTVLRKHIEAHDGQILQYFGDGTLIIFDSAIEAVLCAKHIQEELLQNPKVPLRIGIHMGDIMHNDEGIYGDGVNLASRIQSIAVEGAVLFSEKVFNEVQNHPAIPTNYLGSFTLKNVKAPMCVYALASKGLTIPQPREMKGKTTDNLNAFRSVAVLPFVNMSNDEENEYFSDGITEELINALAKIDGMLVTSRTSSFAFKGKNEDVRQIGQKLGVESIIEGSVRKAGKQVRVTAQLIKSGDGYHCWSETFDGELENIFSLQDEISSKIAERFREAQEANRSKPIGKSPSQSIEAYNLYLKGRYYWNKWNPQAIKKAIELYEQALQLDPQFVQPHCALSSAHIFMAATGQSDPIRNYEKSKEYALKALKLDPSYEESHLSVAMVNLLYDWDLEAAEVSFQLALSLNPSHADAHHYYSLLLLARLNFTQSYEEITLALRLDPLSLPINLHLGAHFMACEQYDKALAQFDQVLALDPNFRAAVENKGWTYYAMGQYEQAITCFKRFHSMTNHPLKGLASLGYIYGALGQKEEALACLEKLKQRAAEEKEVSLDSDFSLVYAGLQEYEKAYEHLENALKKRMMGIFIKVNPEWRRIYSAPIYDKLLSKYGLS